MPKKPKRPARVTEVLGFVNAAWKEYWYRSVGFEKADRVSREAREFGTRVHGLIEDYLVSKAVTFTVNSDEEQCAKLIIDWLNKEEVKILYIEESLEDKKLNLVGHTDLIAEYKGEPVIIDWKMSKEHRTEYPLQKAAYAKMANAKFKMSINKGITVRVDKEKMELDVKVYEGLIKVYWPKFKSCLQVYRIFK